MAVDIYNVGGGGGGVAVWGGISGTLANQTDLAGELSNKLESPIAISDVAGLATALGGWTEIRKSADQTINLIGTFENYTISEFSFTVANGKTYEVEITLAVKNMTAGSSNAYIHWIANKSYPVSYYYGHYNQSNEILSVRFFDVVSLTTATEYYNLMAIVNGTQYRAITAKATMVFTANENSTIQFSLRGVGAGCSINIFKNSILRYRELT